MKTLLLTIVLSGIGFAVERMIIPIKLMHNHLVSKQYFLKTSLFSAPILLLSFVLATYIGLRKEKEPFEVWKLAFRIRIVLVALSLIASLLPQFNVDHKELKTVYYFLLVAIASVYLVFSKLQGMSQSSLFAQISDRTCAGTYMSLCRTITEFGGSGTALIAAYLVDILTFKHCEPKQNMTIISNTSLSNRISSATNPGCTIVVNGVYILSLVCITVALMTNQFVNERLRQLYQLNKDLWKIHKSHKAHKESHQHPKSQ